MTKLKIDHSSYKVGMDEVEGLESALTELSRPIMSIIQNHIYWDSRLQFEPVEYRSRDGFFANSHNCGGLALWTVIPKCEEHSFSYLNFGDFDDDDYQQMSTMADDEADDYRSTIEGEGHHDASLRIWLKFEGLNDDGHMMFWFYIGGGNGDAPYFRHKAESTVYESSFTAATLSELKQLGKQHIKQMLKVIR